MIRKSELVSANGLLVFSKIVEYSAIRGMDLHGLAMRYALERFLARVFAADAPAKVSLDGASQLEVNQDTITLKGGLTMYLAEGVHPLDGRSTSDADFHVVPTADGGHAEQFVAFLRTVLARRPGGIDDGIEFDVDSLDIARVKDGHVPGGKVTVLAQIGKFSVKIRSDLAFDSRPINDGAARVDYPHILPGGTLPPVSIRHTPWEYGVADKVQAMVRHGAGNYRLRDYYDLYVILSRGMADLDRLPDALQATFDLYGSELPESVDDMPALSDAFAEAKTARWEIERETKQYGGNVPSLPEVVAYLRETIDPVLAGMRVGMRPF